MLVKCPPLMWMLEARENIDCYVSKSFGLKLLEGNNFFRMLYALLEVYACRQVQLYLLQPLSETLK
jgi:hypothetical protein